MNFNKFKYIVHSGCSYGRIGYSTLANFTGIEDIFLQKIKDKISNVNVYEVSDNIILVNTAVSSQGSDWQSDSSIYVIEKLLKLGINPQNIYCIIEWSQWTRVANPLPQFLHDKLSPEELIGNGMDKPNDIGIISNQNGDEVSSIIKFLCKEIDIHIGTRNEEYVKKYDALNLAFIEKTAYCPAGHLNPNGMVNPYLKNWIEHSKSIEDSEYIDSKIRRYLNNIIRTQNYLKLKNIAYNFFNMQGCLTGWFLDGDGTVNHAITHSSHMCSKYQKDSFGNIQKSDFYLTKQKEENFIENIFPNYGYLVKQIDFDNYWFYEKNGYRRGGIDEWAIDTFNEVCMSGFQYNNQTGELNRLIIELPQHNFHPREILYSLLWNDIATNCSFLKVSDEYINLLYKLQEEDYNSDNPTENGVTISKKCFYSNITKNV